MLGALLALFLVNNVNCKRDLQKWLSRIICSSESGMGLWSQWHMENKELCKHTVTFGAWGTKIKTS